MGQANYSAFNKWKKVWVAGFLELKHQSILQHLNGLKQLRDGLLLWEAGVADLLETFEIWLPLDNSIMPSGFFGNGWCCVRRNVQDKFRRRGKREVEATSDR
jgi:hypothetical protein